MPSFLPIYYLAPLCSAVCYAIAAMLSKRASQEGFGLARTLFLYNWVTAILFLPLLAFAGEAPDWSAWHWPFLAGVLFFFGQVGTFAAIRVGDISVQSPVMGTKVVFVAAFTVLFGAGTVPVLWWYGAATTALGVYLLSGGNGKTRRKGVLPAIGLALFSAASFAMCDVVVQQHAKTFGAGYFAPVMMFVMAVLGCVVVPFFRGGMFDIPRTAWRWGLAAAVIFTVQAIILYLTLSHYGKATAVNIMYSSRGLWSIMFVWWLGHLLGLGERHEVSRRLMVRRFIGAALLMVAIGLVLAGGEPVE